MRFDVEDLISMDVDKETFLRPLTSAEIEYLGSEVSHDIRSTKEGLDTVRYNARTVGYALVTINRLREMQQARPMTNAELLELAKTHKPPQEWYESPEEDLMAEPTLEITVPLENDGMYGTNDTLADFDSSVTLAFHALQERLKEINVLNDVIALYEYDSMGQIIGLRVRVRKEVPVIHSKKSPSTPEEKAGWELLKKLADNVLDPDGTVCGYKLYVSTVGVSDLADIKQVLK